MVHGKQGTSAESAKETRQVSQGEAGREAGEESEQVVLAGKPKRSTSLRLVVQSMVAGGVPLARDTNGRVVFVEGALPGEEVDTDVLEDKSDYLRGRAVSVLRKSSSRVQPPCPHYLQGCGGCDWQHAGIEAQHGYKVDIIRDAMRRIAHVDDPPISPIRWVSAEDYRTTVRAAADVDGRLQFRRRHRNDALLVPECVIAHPLVQDVLANGRFPGCHEVTVRASVGQRATVAVTDILCEDVIVPSHTTVVTSKEALAHPRRVAQRETVGDTQWRVGVDSFFQSGPQAAELLANTVVEAVGRYTSGSPISVLDLYGGIGLLGGSVLRARDVTGDQLVVVENNASAAGDAASNLSDLDAEVIDTEVANFRWTGDRPPDVLIADPGRPGLGSKVAKQLARLGAGCFVLVSCDPASMARDLAVLIDAGMALSELHPLDLFPHSSHVEVVSVLR